jgi:signal transduction histidine kinase
MHSSFHSLRRRIIVPLLIAAAIAAAVVALASYWIAAASAAAEARDKFTSMRTVVQASSFPLTRNVLDMLENLTGAKWFTVDSRGGVIEFSGESGEPKHATPLARQFSLEKLPLADHQTSPSILELSGKSYQAMRFGDLGVRRGAGEASYDVVVLMDDSIRRSALYRAAAAPLLTGLSTIALLTSIIWFLTERLIQRISKLQHEVEGIARGDFNRAIQAGSNDELGLLSKSVGQMAEQLSQMWQALRQRHGQQLLHQIAGGLAHNLRNTLTGARMAIELVQRKNKIQTDEREAGDATGLAVAVGQLDQAEAYVQRLLLVSRGQEARPQPTAIRECLEGLLPGLESTAQHRGVELRWRYSDSLTNQQVADGPTLLAAISNLIWNAIEAGKHIQVSVELDSTNRCTIEVRDDGPGLEPQIQANLFEPFVSSKSEGLGLGLPLVRRAAESLAGEVQWSRTEGQTVFRFQFPIANVETAK